MIFRTGGFTPYIPQKSKIITPKIISKIIGFVIGALGWDSGFGLWFWLFHLGFANFRTLNVTNDFGSLPGKLANEFFC